jgi:tRNA wybutosine-synthesizing protein 3
MDFAQQKEQVLARKDKSRKGSIDRKIRSLVGIINSQAEYYTSSSCAGRILLFEPGKKKNEMNWLLVRHARVACSGVIKAIDEAKGNEKDIWLRQEPLIIHICCKDIAAAKAMLAFFQRAGLRRAGIISLGKRIMIEAVGTERLDALLARKGNLLISRDSLREIVKEANRRYAQNDKRIKKLEKEMKALIRSFCLQAR